MPNGTTYTDRGHLAGNTLVAVKPDGTAVIYNKMNQPWQDAMQLIGAMYGFNRAAAVSKAYIASDEVTTLGAQQASVQRARDASELEALRISERTKALIIRQTNPLPPVINPLTP